MIQPLFRCGGGHDFYGFVRTRRSPFSLLAQALHSLSQGSSLPLPLPFLVYFSRSTLKTLPPFHSHAKTVPFLLSPPLRPTHNSETFSEISSRHTRKKEGETVWYEDVAARSPRI